MAYDQDDYRDLAFDTDRRLNRYDDDRRWNDRYARRRAEGRPAGRPEGRRHGDPYRDVFARSLRDDRRERYQRPDQPGGDRNYRSYRFPEDEIAGRRGYGSSWSDEVELTGDGYGEPGLSGGYGSDRHDVTYGLSSAEGGLDEDDMLFGEPRDFEAYGDSGAYGGQKGGRSAGYGRHESGLRRESAAVPGAFGGRREARHPDMRGRGPKGYIRSDERIREDVCDVLTDDPQLDAGDMEISIAGGEVTLDGTVSARAAKHHAEDLVEQVSGVRHVQNNLRVKRADDGLPRLEDLPHL